MPELSVVIPVYDERDNLTPLLAELRGALGAVGRSWEVVLVDDGSTDGSAEWIEAQAARDPAVIGLRLARHAGQSAALAAGIARARGQVVVTLDADLQNDPADLPKVLAALADADVVSGVRVRRQDRWLRRASSRVANAVRRAWLGDPITDMGCSFKAYRREALEGLPMFVGVHRFLPALCAFRGARIVEIPLSHRPRRAGLSKYGVTTRVLRGVYDLIGVRWLKARLIGVPIREAPRPPNA
jgi:glycosyltransferase involved in cell wall biosynthesis